MPTCLEPFTDVAAGLAYLNGSWERFAADKALIEQIDLATALELASAQRAAQLVDGLATPGHHFRAVVREDGTMVGGVWFKHSEGEREAFLFDITIELAYRRQGHGRAALAAVEAELAARGCRQLWLNVFARNVEAQGFYAALGYQVGTLHLTRFLDDRAS